MQINVMEATVRQRSKPNLKHDTSTKVGLQHISIQPAGSVKLLREPIWLLIFAFLATILLFIHSRNSVYPEPKTVAGSVPGEFIEERGRAHLDFLTSLGDRPVGSHANEVDAVKYILDQLNSIKENANAVHQIQIDVQQVSGNFTLDDFLGQFTSVYENLNNIILKLSPAGGAEGSLLVNSHYDSIVDSPGMLINIIRTYRFSQYYINLNTFMLRQWLRVRLGRQSKSTAFILRMRMLLFSVM